MSDSLAALRETDRSQYGLADAEFRRHFSICLTNALKAAERIHVALCHMQPPDHTNERVLLDAMHSALIVAEECRQAWSQKVPRPKPEETP